MNGDLLASSLFGAFFAGVGALLIIGALRRWAWLVDPPTWLWFCYSQSLVKAAVGAEGCRAFTLVMGAVFVPVGMFMFVHSLLG